MECVRGNKYTSDVKSNGGMKEWRGSAAMQISFFCAYHGESSVMLVEMNNSCAQFQGCAKTLLNGIAMKTSSVWTIVETTWRAWGRRRLRKTIFHKNGRCVHG